MMMASEEVKALRQRLEAAEKRAQGVGDMYEISLCAEAYEHLEAGKVSEVRRILAELEAPVAKDLPDAEKSLGLRKGSREYFVEPLRAMFK